MLSCVHIPLLSETVRHNLSHFNTGFCAAVFKQPALKFNSWKIRLLFEYPCSPCSKFEENSSEVFRHSENFFFCELLHNSFSTKTVYYCSGLGVIIDGVLVWKLDLLTAYHSELQEITSPSVISTFHEQLRAKSSPAYSVINGRFLVTVSNSGDSKVIRSQALPSRFQHIKSANHQLHCTDNSGTRLLILN